MSQKNRMPEVDFQSSEKLKSAYIYSKFAEEKNLQRAAIASKALRRKRAVLLGSLGFVFGVYFYTITKISQESFLDDFEEPKRIAAP